MSKNYLPLDSYFRALSPVPSILHASCESREGALLHYKLALQQAPGGIPPLNPERMIYVNEKSTLVVLNPPEPIKTRTEQFWDRLPPEARQKQFWVNATQMVESPWGPGKEKRYIAQITFLGTPPSVDSDYQALIVISVGLDEYDDNDDFEVGAFTLPEEIWSKMREHIIIPETHSWDTPDEPLIDKLCIRANNNTRWGWDYSWSQRSFTACIYLERQRRIQADLLDVADDEDPLTRMSYEI